METFWLFFDCLVGGAIMIATAHMVVPRVRDGRMSINRAAAISGLAWALIPIIVAVTFPGIDTSFILAWAVVSFVAVAVSVRCLLPVLLRLPDSRARRKK